jgi:hypothetical protein
MTIEKYLDILLKPIWKCNLGEQFIRQQDK